MRLKQVAEYLVGVGKDAERSGHEVIDTFIDGNDKVFVTRSGGKISETRVEFRDNAPTSIRQKWHCKTVAGYATYLNNYANTDSNLQVASGLGDSFECHTIIDYHAKESANKSLHQASLEVSASDDYLLLVKGLGVKFSQQGAALWLEQLVDIIAQPKVEDGETNPAPTASQMQGLIQSLTVNSNAKAHTSMDNNMSIKKITYEAENRVDVPIPEYFIVAVKMYDEQDEPIGIKVRPMLVVGEDQKPMLSFRAPSLDRMEKDAREEMIELLKASLTVENLHVYE